MGTHNDHIEGVVEVLTTYLVHLIENTQSIEEANAFREELRRMYTPINTHLLLREAAGDMEIDVLECTTELFNGTERVDRHRHWGGR